MRGKLAYAPLKAAYDGLTIAIRADIDALPVKEMTGLPYASKNEGVMHAQVMTYTQHAPWRAAKILASLKDELQEASSLIFQPAEEINLEQRP